MRDKPFHREIGIDAAGFRQGRLGLVHPAVECVGGREVGVRYAVSKTGFDRVANSIDPGAVMTLSEFDIAESENPKTYFRIARTQPQRQPA